MNKRCVIIPAFNEEENIVSVIEGIQKNSEADIMVIDDGSSDLTVKRAKEAGALVISHPFNMGYGTTLQTGYKYAVKKKYDFLVQIDADGQHDPKYIPALFREVEAGRCDVAIGSRFLSEGHYPLSALKWMGIHMLRFATKFFLREKITDPTSGYQCLKRDVLKVFTKDLFPCDYPDANMIILLHWMAFQIKEIPVAMRPNREGRSLHEGIFTVMYYFFKMFLSFVIALIRGKSGSEQRNQGFKTPPKKTGYKRHSRGGVSEPLSPNPLKEEPHV
jgi:glycosyltransferase involved in cell wall biosynthesis